MSVPAPLDPADVLWEGRPALGVLRQDVWAGLTTLGLCWAVLGGGLIAGFGAAPRDAFQLAGVSAAVVATVVTLARSLGASARVHGALAGFLAVTALAGLARGEDGGAQVVWSLLALIPVGFALRWRLRQRRRTRYQVGREQVAIGEEGHYLIRFRYEAAPRVHRDPFGRDLGEVSFRPRDAQLVTREGKVFKMPARALRLHRVRHPQRLLDAIAPEAG